MHTCDSALLASASVAVRFEVCYIHFWLCSCFSVYHVMRITLMTQYQTLCYLKFIWQKIILPKQTYVPVVVKVDSLRWSNKTSQNQIKANDIRNNKEGALWPENNPEICQCGNTEPQSSLQPPCCLILRKEHVNNLPLWLALWPEIKLVISTKVVNEPHFWF
jgi:hypothetical protein